MTTCIAWDLIGWHSDKLNTTHLVRLKGGRTLYEAAYQTRTQNIRLARLVVDGSALYQVNRYVPHDAVVELVEIAVE